MEIEPIGCTLSSKPRQSVSLIKVDPIYIEGLNRIEENSHLWILSWFDQADRAKLKTTATKLDSKKAPIGVFSLRSPARPNPIALTLVELIKIEGSILHVTHFDAFEGTKILDIKPYYEKDRIFSPKTPAIFPKNRERKINRYTDLAVNHHQEKCLGVIIAVKMSLLAEKHFGILTNPELTVAVEGSNCLIDALQATTSARFANPERLTISKREDCWVSRWKHATKEVEICFDLDKYSITSLEDLEVIPEDDLLIFKEV